MPLGFEPEIAQAMTQMSERYGNRLVDSLAQAGQTIETGLKNVTTMKELSSLGQQMSQLSPDSPDYQQQLIGLGAAHPFAMQTQQGQAMIHTGNQQFMQQQSFRQAMKMSEIQDARSQRHDNATLSRQEALATRHDANALAIAKLKHGEDVGSIDFSGGLPQKQTPVAGLSFGAGMDGPQGTVAPQDAAPTPPDGFSFGAGQQGLVSPEQPSSQAQPAPDNQAVGSYDDEIRQLGASRQKRLGRPLTNKETQDVFKAVESRHTLESRNNNVQRRFDARMDEKKLENEAKAKQMGAKEVMDGIWQVGNGQLFTFNNSGEPEHIGSPKTDKPDIGITTDLRVAAKIKEDAEKTYTEAAPQFKRAAMARLDEANANYRKAKSAASSEQSQNDDDTVYSDEAAALKAGKKKGDKIMVTNPRTGKPARAILE